MKEIKAYIKPHMLAKVTLALHQLKGLTGMSVVNAKGFGRSLVQDYPKKGVEGLIDYVPHVRIEVICLDTLAEDVISTIQKAAYTGLRGDGKIYISTVEDAVRIETEERGEGAV